MDGVERGGDSHAFPGFIIFHNLDFGSVRPISWRFTGVDISCTMCRKKVKNKLISDIFDTSKSSHVHLDTVVRISSRNGI